MFLINGAKNLFISYEDLILSLNSGHTTDYISSVVLNLINNREIKCWDLEHAVVEGPVKIENKEDLLAKIASSESTIFLRTSGTTGKPKTITHSASRIYENTRRHSQPAVWGLTYNPRHMGGLQVIFQALANGNTLVDLYRKDRDSVLMEIKERSVSHLSATPTFYRLLGPPSVSLPLVMRVTVGGELAQGSTFQLIEKMFPEASINNIYATTETGAILFSKNEVFEVNKKVRITDNILYVKGPSGSWYNTGDTVEVCSENPLRFTFTGRSTDIINVGGNNVNPNQIEEILRNHPDIKDALVFGKKNSVLGNILACEIVSRKDSLSKEDVVNHLNSFNLEGFKIPRFFKFKEEVAISDNLKTKR